MKLCVTGGAGYIGSVVVELLLQKGHDVTILDNLSTGHRDAVPEQCLLVEGDIKDRAALDRALSPDTDAVFHFAALSIVGDSVSDPLSSSRRRTRMLKLSAGLPDGLSSR